MTRSRFRPGVLTPIVLALVLLPLLPAATASAHTIDPYTFEELVEDSAFTGLVECVTAGGVVARYKVLETWKGDLKPGDTFTLRVANSYWGPQFPVAFVGDRYVVTAAVNPATRLMSYTSHGGVPLFWRQLPSDYRLPLFQGRVRVAGEGEDEPAHGYYLGTTKFEHLGTLRAAAERFADADGPMREMLLLSGLARKYYGLDNDELEPPARALRDAIDGLPTLPGLLTAVGAYIQTQGDNRDWAAGRWASCIADRGGAAVIEQLQKLPAATLAIPAEKVAAAIEAIRHRLQPPAEDGESGEGSDGEMEAEDAPANPAPTADELAEWTKALKAGGDAVDPYFNEIMNRMPQHAPGPLVDYLRTWENPQRGWRDAHMGYVLGAWVCWKCKPEGRAGQLKRLLDAKTPYIRVAAAIWLTFDDRDAGMAALKKCLDLPGNPGTWAAINLLRRGDGSAMNRALECLKATRDAGMATVPDENLRLRLRVLISNSAAASDVPQPSFRPNPDATEADNARAFHAACVAWWDQYRDKVKMHDPWFEQLAEQRVD